MSVTVVQVKPINPLLASYLQSLATRPIRTKAATSGVLSFISEILAGQLSGTAPPPLAAKDRSGFLPLDLAKRYDRALKMAAYGYFVSAPMGHYLLEALQKLFAGKTSARAKVLMILVSNLFISPIQQSVYISAMAIINGARSLREVKAILRKSFLPVMKLTWVISTLCMITAQRFIAPELWIPFFNIVGATVGTYLNVQVKKQALAASKGKKPSDDTAL